MAPGLRKRKAERQSENAHDKFDEVSHCDQKVIMQQTQQQMSECV
jgi:hypothetical protein